MNGVLFLLAHAVHGAADAARLRFAQRQRQFAARKGGVEPALAAVFRSGHLTDIAAIDKLFQYARKALLGDLQGFQKIGDGHARLAGDEIDDAVVSAPEAYALKDRVRIGGEVAIGEKEKFYGGEIDAAFIDDGQ